MADDLMLTPLERAVLLVLMAEARELSSSELHAEFGLALSGQSRRRLNELKLMESVKYGLSYRHALTDLGWRYCRTQFDHESELMPGAGGATTRALLRGLGRFLAKNEYSLADVFDLAMNPNPAVRRASTVREVEDRIRKAYWQMASHPGDWVKLSVIRPMLGPVPAEDADAALSRMLRSRDVIIIPESNQKMLTAEDRAAAVMIGGEPKHLISIGTP